MERHGAGVLGRGLRDIYQRFHGLGNLRRSTRGVNDLERYGNGHFRCPTDPVLFGDVYRFPAADHRDHQSAHRHADLHLPHRSWGYRWCNTLQLEFGQRHPTHGHDHEP